MDLTGLKYRQEGYVSSVDSRGELVPPVPCLFQSNHILQLRISIPQLESQLHYIFLAILPYHISLWLQLGEILHF